MISADFLEDWLEIAVQTPMSRAKITNKVSAHFVKQTGFMVY